MSEIFERAIPVVNFEELNGLRVKLQTIKEDGITYLFAFGEHAIYGLGEQKGQI